MIHPESKVKVMKARLLELGKGTHGTKAELWARLSAAEEAHAKEMVYQGELERRQEANRQGKEGAISMRTVPGPAAPRHERAGGMSPPVSPVHGAQRVGR